MTTALYEDELLFLAHSVTLEQEAAERLYELADTLEVHNNRPLHTLFLELAQLSERHASDVLAHCQGRQLPALQAWEYSWPDAESPESFQYSQVHYLMSAEQALQVALEVEQNTLGFYSDVARRTTQPSLRQLAEGFAREESEHVKAVQARLQALQCPALNNLDLDPPHSPE
ncbi:MAG: ferritin family protein [Pseudomonadota bacterium]|nr:ferritin family protein [Pseudomonadota bacterium]